MQRLPYLQSASLAPGSLTDLRLEFTFEPFPATKTKKGLKAEARNLCVK